MTDGTSKRKTREEILELSAPLFGRLGYDGVSMRDVAGAVGLTPAALYYHFSDKQQLYLDTVAHEFREKMTVLAHNIQGPAPAWARLEGFVAGLAQLLAKDKDFLRLLQWVLLDSDETRQHKLAKQVFTELFTAVHNLAEALDSRRDAHQLAISIVGLVMFTYQAGTTRQFMPGYRAQQNRPDAVARHVCDLLRTGLGTPRS